MEFQLRLLALLALLYVAVAYPKATSDVVHEKRELTHPRWIRRSRIPLSVTFPMRIGLTQRNLDKGFDFIMDV